MPPQFRFAKQEKVTGKMRISKKKARGFCIGCGTCADICPADALTMVNRRPKVLYPEECFHCGACAIDCPQDAITYRFPIPMLLPVHAIHSSAG